MLETKTVGGRYTLERVLGQGGMATVYYALDTTLHRPVALKLLADTLADDVVFRKRLRHEARIAGRLSHPSIVQVYDAGEEDARPYIVMEYVDGETLRAVLDRRGRLPADEVISLGAEVCAGLAYAHGAGLVHRDIKPKNLLLARAGGVKIVDFGIALSNEATRFTDHGEILGTAGYLAPEQAAGQQVTAAADIYSLGVVLYELLSGEKPFVAQSLPELLAQQHASMARPLRELAPDVPPALDQTVCRCLLPDPAERPASAAQLGHTLTRGSPDPDPPTKRLEASTAVQAEPRSAPSAHQRPTLRRPSRPRALLGLAVLLIAIVGATLALTLPGDTDNSSSDVPAIRRADDPTQQARNLAEWFRGQAQSATDAAP